MSQTKIFLSYWDESPTELTVAESEEHAKEKQAIDVRYVCANAAREFYANY